MTNTNSKIKPTKIGKQSRTTYCFPCKEVKMKNKELIEKSNCVVCRSNKSRFFKTKTN